MAHTSPYPVLDGAGRPLPVGDGAGRKRLASRRRAGRGALGTARAGLALRGEGRPCGAGFVPRALEGTEREHGRLPFRAGGNGGGGIRRKAKPQGLACVSAGAGPGHARWGGRRKARGSLHACAMPRRFGGGMTPGRCSAGSSCRCAVAGHAGGNGRCGALCRPEGAALSSPGPAGGERGNALPGFPCPGTFLAPRPFQRWREQRGGRAGEGEDAAHRADETRAEGMRWQAAGPHIAWLEEPCRWREGEAASAAGRRGAESVFRMAHLSGNPSFSMPEGTARGKAGSRAGVARRAVPGWLKEPCRGARRPGRWREGRAASAAAGARKACSAWPICPKSFLFHAGGNGAGEGRGPGRGGSKSRAASHGARRRVPQRGRGKRVPLAHLSEILPFPCRRERRRGRPGVGPGWLEEPCRWLEGRAASAAAGARKASE